MPHLSEPQLWRAPRAGRRRGGVFAMTATALAAAAAFWLLREHGSLALGDFRYAPYGLFLACPLMHLILLHGHGGRGRRPRAGQRGPGSVARVTPIGWRGTIVRERSRVSRA